MTPTSGVFCLCAKMNQMQFWLMKSEPAEFSVDDLQRVGCAPWDGVRNYQVRNMFRDQFAVGDRALFYHSNTKEIGVTGEMEVVSDPYPDPTQFDPKDPHFDPRSDRRDPRWLMVDVSFIKKFVRVVPLSEIRGDKLFVHSPLVQKGNRLSVLPLTKSQYKAILKYAAKS